MKKCLRIVLSAYYAGQLTKEDSVPLKYRERNEEKRGIISRTRNEVKENSPLYGREGDN